MGGEALSWKLGALNTVVLILSSWTMAMGVRCAMTSQKKAMLHKFSCIVCRIPG